MTWSGLLMHRVGVSLPRAGQGSGDPCPLRAHRAQCRTWAARRLRSLPRRCSVAAPKCLGALGRAATGWGHLLIAGAPDVFAWDERLRFLAAGRPIRDLPNPNCGPCGPRWRWHDRGCAESEVRRLGAALRGRVSWDDLSASAWSRQRPDAAGGARYRRVRLASAPIRPLRAEIIVENRSETRTIERADAAIAFRETSRLADGESFDATWMGQLVVEQAGKYRLELFTDGTSELLIDGKTVAEGRGTPEQRREHSVVTWTSRLARISWSYGIGMCVALGLSNCAGNPPATREPTLIPPSAVRRTRVARTGGLRTHPGGSIVVSGALDRASRVPGCGRERSHPTLTWE